MNCETAARNARAILQQHGTLPEAERSVANRRAFYHFLSRFFQETMESDLTEGLQRTARGAANNGYNGRLLSIFINIRFFAILEEDDYALECSWKNGMRAAVAHADGVHPSLDPNHPLVLDGSTPAQPLPPPPLNADAGQIYRWLGSHRIFLYGIREMRLTLSGQFGGRFPARELQHNFKFPDMRDFTVVTGRTPLRTLPWLPHHRIQLLETPDGSREGRAQRIESRWNRTWLGSSFAYLCGWFSPFFYYYRRHAFDFSGVRLSQIVDLPPSLALVRDYGFQSFASMLFESNLHIGWKWVLYLFALITDLPLLLWNLTIATISTIWARNEYYAERGT
jgi:hypothetical protein